MIKVLLDNNLPPSLCEVLDDLGVDAIHVSALGLADATDHAVWKTACDQGRVVVTKDIDFVRIALANLDGTRQVVHVRTGNLAKRALSAVFLERWADVARRLEAGEAMVELDTRAS